MGFYTDSSFFIVLGVLALPAVCLGLLGRRVQGYAQIVNVVMLLFLFSSSLRSFVLFLLFCLIATAGTQIVLRTRTPSGVHSGIYAAVLLTTTAPLVIYKVSAAAGHSILGFIGISYLTFRALQVLIEIKDDLIDHISVRDYLFFLTFFAHITSGPIDRSRRFISDAHAQYTSQEYADLFTRGLLLLLTGAVFQLVIATIIRAFYDPAAAVPGTLHLIALPIPFWAQSIVQAYCYGLYLFFDFAGYSLMVMGVSYWFGIRCPRNFRAPFAAIDLKDFWNRWHITLSTWLRDFVFMRFTRLAMRRKWFKNRLALPCVGYFINMMLMGAWHGITVDYLAYGAYHGVLLAVTEVYQKKSSFYKRNRKKTWYRALSWLVTLQLVIFGFALFSGQIRGLIEGIMYG